LTIKCRRNTEGIDAKSVNRKCNAGQLIHQLKVTNGQVAAFDNCPQTFSWIKGGYTKGTPPSAQVGSAESTASAIYVNTAMGKPAGIFNFTVDIPIAKVTTSVYIYLGSCGNIGSLDVTLSDAKTGAVEKEYTQKINAKKLCQYTAVATFTIPSGGSSGAARTLSGSWTQDAADHLKTGTNIQLHAIAVDAGGVVPGGVGVPCGHGGGGGSSGSNVVLQAAVLV
jgi:hypothetical protein